jgi:hypothetical protein
MQSVGFLGPALFLTLIGGVTSATQAVVYMTLVWLPFSTGERVRE